MQSYPPQLKQAMTLKNNLKQLGIAPPIYVLSETTDLNMKYKYIQSKLYILFSCVEEARVHRQLIYVVYGLCFFSSQCTRFVGTLHYLATLRYTLVYLLLLPSYTKRETTKRSAFQPLHCPSDFRHARLIPRRLGTPRSECLGDRRKPVRQVYELGVCLLRNFYKLSP